MAQHETQLKNYAPAQVLTGSLIHFTVDFVAGATDYDNAFIHGAMLTIGTRATIVMMGDFNTNAIRIAVENSSDWTEASLQVALRLLTDDGGVTANSITVSDFNY